MWWALFFFFYEGYGSFEFGHLTAELKVKLRAIVTPGFRIFLFRVSEHEQQQVQSSQNASLVSGSMQSRGLVHLMRIDA